MNHSYEPFPVHEQQIETLIQPGSPEELEAILRSMLIPVDQWNPENDAKTIQQLFNEIKGGDSQVFQVRTIDESGTEHTHILRQTRVVWIDVYWQDQDGQKCVLKEQKLEPKDGRKPKQREDLLASLAEKCKIGECIDDAVVRALFEELKITEPLPTAFHRKEHLPTEFSRSYPGLPTRADAHFFSADLPDHLFKPEGYIVTEKDKTNYFEWVPVQVESSPA